MNRRLLARMTRAVWRSGSDLVAGVRGRRASISQRGWKIFSVDWRFQVCLLAGDSVGASRFFEIRGIDFDTGLEDDGKLTSHFTHVLNY
jgi:hypothetical protein